MGCASSKATSVVVPVSADQTSINVNANRPQVERDGKTAGRPVSTEDIIEPSMKDSSLLPTAKPEVKQTITTAPVSPAKLHNEASSPSSSGQTEKQHGLPPMTPPRKTKSDLVPDLTVFDYIDTRVENTPKAATNSIQSLANYLTSPCPDELHRVRAIFCWLAANIAYDTNSYFSGDTKPQDAASVLKSGIAVCEGYSQLCKALCDAADVTCKVVSGIAKGYSHDPENVYTADSKTNHAWNIVVIQGEWHLLDCTWGAGSLGEGGNFQREFSEIWFLTDPADFLPKHFPLMNGDPVGSKAYQLLKKPINIDEFSAMVYRDSLAVQVGLRFLTHTQAVISVQRNVTVKVKATTQPLLSVSACLIERGPKAVEDRTNVMTSLHVDGTCSVYVRPPLVATFLLEIMGSTDPREGGSTRVSRLATYVIKCIETEANVEPFPDKFGAWGLEYPVAAECGLKKVKDAPFLFTAKDGQVQIPIPHDGCTKMITSLCHAEDTETDLKQYTFVEMSEERATVRVRLPRPGYYKLSLFASNPEQKSCPLVGDLLIHADKGCGDLQPFPVTYSFACEIRARLLQPLVGQVKRGQATLYRLLAPSLAKAMVAKKMMEMKNDGAWEAEVVADKGLDKVGIFGSVDKNDSSLSGLYEFDVVAG